MSRLLSSLILLSFLISCNNDSPNTKAAVVPSTALVYHKSALDTTIIGQMEIALNNNEYPNIHSVLVNHNEELLYENYWKGNDEIWGGDIGVRVHGRDSLHDIRSISKSIVSACVGIAIEQGKAKSIDQSVFDFFPEFKKQDTGIKSSLTIKHLLTMSSGLKWNEEVPYDNPENSEVGMARSSNPVEYVLRQPMESVPGKLWKYNGGTTQLLASIIQKTTGKRIDSFANEFLFQPLGIKSFEWVKYPGTEMPAAASGIRLKSIDLMKFGLLYLNNGKVNGQQLLSPEWTKASLSFQVARGDGGGYGYQFWLWKDFLLNKEVDLAVGVGNGNQRLFIDKADSLVVVITAGNYNKWDIIKESGRVFKDFVYPAIFKR